MNSLTDADEFLHHGIVDLQTARGIDDDRVESLFACPLNGIGGNGGNIDAGTFRMNGNFNFFSDNFQLVNGGGTVNVTGNQQDFLSIVTQFESQFAGGRGFTAAVETDQHNNGGFSAGGKFGNAAAQEFNQLVVDDFDDLLTGGHAFDNFLTDAFIADGFDEFADDLQIDVSLEQGKADFAHGLGDIFLCQRALSTEFTENIM